MERVELETVLPPRHLRPFVRRYLYANKPLGSEVTFQAKPTGYSYLSSFFGRSGNERGSINGRPFKRVSRAFLFGQITDHDVRFHHSHALRLIVCELTATSPYRLLGISGQHIVGLAAALDEVAPEKAAVARNCFILGEEASRDEHVAEANTYFTRLAEHALPEDPVVERAVQLLETSNGTMRIAEICKRLGIERRRLNRGFTRIIGLRPKFFGRIMQINQAVDLLYSSADSELARIAQEAGFYDQAHFTHAMQRFFNEGPRDFLRSEHHAFLSFLAGSRRLESVSPAAE